MIGLQWLFSRNKESIVHDAEAEKLFTPFVIAATCPNTDVECEISADARVVFFDFADAFSIQDENIVIRDMGMSSDVMNALLML